MHKLLYVDDEDSNLVAFEVVMSTWFQVLTLNSPLQAIEVIGKEDIQVLITDQRMPKMTGLELAKLVQKEYPSVIVILLTAYDDSEVIKEALNQGGIFRFLLKPWEVSDMKQTLLSAFEAYGLRKKNITLINDLINQNRKLQHAYNEINTLKERLEEENVRLKDEFVGMLPSTDIVGESKAMKQVLKQLQQAAKSNASVLLLGETGTGKELFAKTIHNLSPRKEKLLIKINCAAIPETLIESELFGFEKGAFTGADKLKLGKIELAHEGTLFLDEIGELPVNMQPKLLRVLQENEFERIGSNKTVKVNFRLISATNRRLEEEIGKGSFRSDLFYRLNIIPITIPPLRNHAEDIPLLVQHFIRKFNQKSGGNVDSVSKKTMDKLLEYHWPGNIRELENVIERAHVLSTNNKLEIGDWFSTKQSDTIIDTDIVSIEENERQYILRVLKAAKWKIRGVNGAAQLMKINPTTLESRMKKLGIERPI